MVRAMEWITAVLGGLFGWFIGKFEPAFPLIYVATAFILYDSWTAFELDIRVKKQFPDKKRRPAKYNSNKAWNIVPTLIESCTLIILFYAAQRWIFVDFYVPLSYIATGVICGIQLLSIAENKASCRQPEEKGYKVWRVLAKVLIDKTERHFDADLSELKENLEETK